MKLRYTLLFLPAVFIPLALIAQGPLTPPAGAPAPLMKTLQQVEPRVDVATLTGDASTTVVISSAGSYYLSSNVVVPAGRTGIAITTAGVTLDLNGFSISGVGAASLRGVELRGPAHGAAIRNGTISSIGGGPGVGFTGAGLANVRLEDLTILNCASGVVLGDFSGVTAERIRVTSCTATGLDLGVLAVASHCAVDFVQGSSATLMCGICAGLVTDCAVSQITNTGGLVQGINAEVVKSSTAQIISGAAAGTSGINGSTVSNCRVNSVRLLTGTGSVRGINAGGVVSGCMVSSTGIAGPGTPTGIQASTVTGCQADTIGNAASTGNIIGISGVQNVSHCAVHTAGASGASVQVLGIFAESANSCTVLNLLSSSRLTGIQADTVTACSVEALTQSGSSSEPVSGFVTVRVTDSRATSLSGSSVTGNTVGFNGYRMASGCLANTISNTTGIATGFIPSNNGSTLHCEVENTTTFGVSGPGGLVIRGCSIHLNGAGTGINAGGTGAVIEDNAVYSCTTGINAAGANCLVVRNRIISSTTNISASATSQVGPIVTGTGVIASTSPWANFTD